MGQPALYSFGCTAAQFRRDFHSRERHVKQAQAEMAHGQWRAAARHVWRPEETGRHKIPVLWPQAVKPPAADRDRAWAGLGQLGVLPFELHAHIFEMLDGKSVGALRLVSQDCFDRVTQTRSDVFWERIVREYLSFGLIPSAKAMFYAQWAPSLKVGPPRWLFREPMVRPAAGVEKRYLHEKQAGCRIQQIFDQGSRMRLVEVVCPAAWSQGAKPPRWRVAWPPNLEELRFGEESAEVWAHLAFSSRADGLRHLSTLPATCRRLVLLNVDASATPQAVHRPLYQGAVAMLEVQQGANEPYPLWQRFALCRLDALTSLHIEQKELLDSSHNRCYLPVLASCSMPSLRSFALLGAWTRNHRDLLFLRHAMWPSLQTVKLQWPNVAGSMARMERQDFIDLFSAELWRGVDSLCLLDNHQFDAVFCGVLRKPGVALRTLQLMPSSFGVDDGFHCVRLSPSHVHHRSFASAWGSLTELNLVCTSDDTELHALLAAAAPSLQTLTLTVFPLAYEVWLGLMAVAELESHLCHYVEAMAPIDFPHLRALSWSLRLGLYGHSWTQFGRKASRLLQPQLALFKLGHCAPPTLEVGMDGVTLRASAPLP